MIELVNRPSRKTAREVLVYVAGKEHELHSVADCKNLSSGKMKIVITCSCGEKFKVEDTLENMRSLVNAPKVGKSDKS